MAKAQLLQIEKVCSSLKGHPALHSYDLGNEASNFCIPGNRTSAWAWLQQINRGIHQYSGGVPVTLGIHARILSRTAIGGHRMLPVIAITFLCTATLSIWIGLKIPMTFIWYPSWA